MTLNRRTFLRGAGVVLGLPLLEVMQPSISWARGDAPRRLVFVFFPNGANMSQWTPESFGSEFAFSPSLQSLEQLSEDVTILSGITNPAAEPQGDGIGDHQRGTASFLTATHIHKSATDIFNGVSADQVAAQHLASQTPLPSLQLGLEGNLGTENCERSYNCAYSRSISWADPRTPLGQQINPATVFEQLVRDPTTGLTPQEQAKEQMYRRSILDFVLEDLQTLKGRVSLRDRHKLDEYATALREMETRLQHGPACELNKPPSALGDIPSTVRSMCDLIVHAFTCDATRVITLMLGNGGSNLQYDFAGVPGAHHSDVSHHQGRADKLDDLHKINVWQVEQLSYLLKKLASVEEDGERLLDRTLVLFSSEVSDPDAHTHTDMPVALAGRCPRLLTPGRHVRVDGAPMGNLLITMLQSVGIYLDSFGEDGKGPLVELL